MGTTIVDPRGHEEFDLQDEKDLRAAHRAHAGELFRFALRRLGDRGAAEDVVQEVFLRAWRAAGTFDRSRVGLRAWLFAIARNVVVDFARRRAVRPVQPIAAETLVAMAGADDGFDDTAVTAWTVEEALHRLTDEHRTAIVETYLKGRSYTEVAAELGVPIGTVRTRVFYGLKSLRLAMEEMGVRW
jgi:RNA polymerase sigma-70 factor, ECF subfamily